MYTITAYLQRIAGEKPYMWAYLVHKDGALVCSGGLYASQVSGAPDARRKIISEVQGRIPDDMGDNYNIELDERKPRLKGGEN